MLICGLPNFFFPPFLGLVTGCAEEIQGHIKQNLASFSQDSSFELGEVFCLPSAAILFLLECGPKVFYGAEEGHSWWVVMFGDVADSFVFWVALA